MVKIQKFVYLIFCVMPAGIFLFARTDPIVPPPNGTLYQGFYWGGIGTDDHDPTEHDVSSPDVIRYEEAVGKKAAWVYFSDNWFESRQFPAQMCRWIHDLGKIPYVRLMLRSDVDQNHAESKFSLAKIIAGDFDADLRIWARHARDFNFPILIEWGTEPNGEWFAWNGRWNGGASHGPVSYVAAYHHIVDLMRAEGADNLQWVWHVNWDDQPERKWNRFENYFPGTDYCDWVALSCYGPTTPLTNDGAESFAFKMETAYPRLTKLAPGKPLIVAEFGCDLHNKHADAVNWAKGALDELFSGRWPSLVGFCWWNEGWQNDDHRKHDTDMIVLHNERLLKVFQDSFTRNASKIQETPILAYQ